MKRINRSRRLLAALVILTGAVVLTACGDDDAADPAVATSDNPPGESSEQSSRGAAVLTVGDQSWEFDNVQCAVGSDETNSTDWDFSMVASIEGLQLIVDRSAPEGRFGDSISLVGTDSPTNPSVAWEAPAADLTGGTPIQSSFVMVAGDSVVADTTFWNDLDATGEAVPGSLVASCP